jgi:hypothetical protein
VGLLKIVTIPSSTSYSNLNTLASISVSKSFVITNHTSGLVSIIVSPTQPADDARGVPIYTTQTFYVEESDTIVWVKGVTGKLVIQDTGEIVSPYSVANLPKDVWTSSSEGFRRLRVDQGQTSLFEGREFRSFFEFNIPSGNVQIFKFVSPIDFVLFEQSLSVDAGSIRFQALTGATEVATFNTALPIIGKNRMAQRKQPYYTSVITITTHAAPVVFGSGVTGGTVVENTRIVAANATAQQQTVSGGAQSERGLSAGTYYLRLHNFGSGAATGVYSLFWEEKPV